MDEFHEIVTWRQLRIHDKPIGLLNTGGFYDHLLALYDRMQSEGFLSQPGRGLFVSAPSIRPLLELMRI
jgi:predicted Rossmann-fold nucleotide-binding protein